MRDSYLPFFILVGAIQALISSTSIKNTSKEGE